MNQIRVGLAIIATIIFVGSITLLVHTELNKEQDIRDKYNENRIITTKYGDKFLLKEKRVAGGINPGYDIEVFDASDKNSKPLLKLEKVGQVDIIDLYKDDFIKSYKVDFYLLYKIKGKEYQSVQISEISKLDAIENKYLIPVVKALLHYKWYFKEDTSDFLIKSGDQESIELVKRYADGDFNDEELESIKVSAYTKEDIQNYFETLIQKYKIE